LFGGWLVTTVSEWEPSNLGPLRMFGWQWVLLLMGLPGLITAALFLCLREPTRRGRVAGDKGMSLREVMRQVCRYCWNSGVMSLHGCFWNGTSERYMMS